MIIEKLFDVQNKLTDPVPGFVLIIIAVACIFFSFAFFNQRKFMAKLIGVLLMTIGVAALVELSASLASMPDYQYVTKVEKYPVEYRPENNTMYVFYEDDFKKVSKYTDEYVHKDDTMYVYHMLKVGGIYEWGDEVEQVFIPMNNIHYLDSLNTEIIITTQDTVRLEIGPEGGFIIPEVLDSLVVPNEIK